MGIFRLIFNSTTSLTFTLLIYSVIGAFLFMYLENGIGVHEHSDVKPISEQDIDGILQSIRAMKDDKEMVKWTTIEEEFNRFTKMKSDLVVKEEFDIWKSLFFCFTVYTTIGYGNIVPKTDSGRAFTCIYALIGIPICLMVLDRIGRLQLRFLQSIYKQILRLLQIPDEFDSSMIYFMISIIFAYICIGYIIYERSEHWSIFESIYFLLITFTTIGFGDVCPEDSKYVMVTIIYQFIGLSFMSTFINAVVAKLEESRLVSTFIDKEKSH